jgi:hypothetical protein
MSLKDRNGHFHSKSGSSFQQAKEQAHSGKIIQAPHNIPVTHGFSRTIVYMLADASLKQYNAVKIEALGNNDQNFIKEIALENVVSNEPAFNQLAANALLCDMEMSSSWLHESDVSQTGQGARSSSPMDIKQEAEHVAMLWGLASNWTSFVAIEELNQTKQRGTLHRFLHSRRELEELVEPRQSENVFYTGFVPPDMMF